MILTYKIKHGKDFTQELRKAKKIAEFAIHNRDKLSTKYVKAIGLKAAISNQILRKYGRDKKCKKTSNVLLSICGKDRVQQKGDVVYISCLALRLKFPQAAGRVNQVELDKEYAYIMATVDEAKEYKEKVTIGIDRNTTGHIAVAAIAETGKVLKLGKQALHIRRKYSNIRKDLQKRGKFKKLAVIKRRESNIVRDINHKISRQLVNTASKLKGRLVLENLKGIRGGKNHVHSFRYALNSWSFYQLQTFLEYKAKLAGVPLSYIDPYRTSKCCSRCGLVGTRINKSFKCQSCGHVDHADVNAAFNISNVHKGVFDFRKKEFTEKGVLVPR